MVKPVRVTRYDVTSPFWSLPPLRVAVVSDLHVCARWMPLERVHGIVEQVMAEAPDLVLLPGDFLIRKMIGARPVPATAIAEVLFGLSAPLGVYASLGNHDWHDCPMARGNGFTASSVNAALEDVGIPVLTNQSLRLSNGAYLVGLDSMVGEGSVHAPKPRHDADAAFRDVPDGASVVLMAHEPEFFLQDKRPVALQVSGHTHGGQIGKPGMWLHSTSPEVRALDFGHRADGGRNVVITTGVGYSLAPLRIATLSEIVVTRIGPAVQQTKE